MAELPDLGEHCFVKDCQQIDFLPVTCPWCGERLCKDHSAPEAHSCTKFDESCARPVYTGEKAVSCTFHECTNRELTPVICPHCLQNFCLQHRHQVDHACPRLQQQTSEKQPELFSQFKGTGQKSASGPSGRKSRHTAAKVALMKLKQKSVGDRGIPDSEKLYFSVSLPPGSATDTLAAFFSKEWTVGRVIDEAASRARVKNQNNVHAAPKLRLFHESAPLPVEESLETVCRSLDIPNGGSLQLRYVTIS